MRISDDKLDKTSPFVTLSTRLTSFKQDSKTLNIISFISLRRHYSMQKKIIVGALTIASLFVQSSFHSAHAKKKVEAYPACSSKVPVAVDRFKTENISVGWWNKDVALNSREVAVDELVNSGCFSVLEREEGSMAPVGVMNEKNLARSDEAKSGSKAAKKKQMKVAENLVSYALTGVSKDNSGFGIGGIGGGFGGGSGGIGGIGVGTKKSDISLSCKLINTSSSEILASSRVTISDSSLNVGLAGGGGSLGGFGGGGLGFFKDTKIGKMMAEAIHNCTVNLAKTASR